MFPYLAVEECPLSVVLGQELQRCVMLFNASSQYLLAVLCAMCHTISQHKLEVYTAI